MKKPMAQTGWRERHSRAPRSARKETVALASWRDGRIRERRLCQASPASRGYRDTEELRAGVRRDLPLLSGRQGQEHPLEHPAAVTDPNRVPEPAVRTYRPRPETAVDMSLLGQGRQDDRIRRLVPGLDQMTERCRGWPVILPDQQSRARNLETRLQIDRKQVREHIAPFLTTR